MDIQLARANRILGLGRSVAWPDFFTVRDLAKLQGWSDTDIPGMPGLSGAMWDIATSLGESKFAELIETGLAYEVMPSVMQMRQFVGVIGVDQEGNPAATHSTVDAGTIERPGRLVRQTVKIVYREGFAAWLNTQRLEPSPMTRSWLESSTEGGLLEAQPAPTQAPAPGIPASGALPLKKAAMIAAHVHEWPSIERDINDAHENGLSAAAKAGKRGWREDAAMNWARANGKLKTAEKPAAVLAREWHGEVRKHTLKG